MKVVIQRVKSAQVKVNLEIIGKIGMGMLVLLGVCEQDTKEDADYLVQKLINLRIFEDSQGKMNLSAIKTNAEFLVVSQFTIYGDCVKGRRPSFDKVANPEKGEELYNYFINKLKNENVKVETGIFKAMMDVSLVNNGPVTFILESKVI